MVRIAVIAAIIVLALMIFSIIDCSRTPESQIRSLPKWAWLVIIIFVPGIGALAGSSQAAQKAMAVAVAKERLFRPTIILISCVSSNEYCCYP